MLEKIKALSGQVKAQALRFVRLTALSAFAIWVANGKHLDASAAWGAVVGGGEVVLRQWRTTALARVGAPVDWSSGPPVVPDPAPVADVVPAAPVVSAPAVLAAPAEAVVAEPTAPEAPAAP